MLKETTKEEMMEVDGGSFLGNAGWYVGEKVFEATIKHNAYTPYEKTVTRQGQKYTVKYDGKPGW